MSIETVTPPQGSTTRYGDHHKPNNQKQYHKESSVIDGTIGTTWHYRFCNTHEYNDNNNINHINNIRKFFNTINKNTNGIHIMHQQKISILTLDMIQNATNIMDICTNATENTTKITTTYYVCVHSSKTSNMKLLNPLESIQGELPTAMSYHIDDFKGHPTKLLRIVTHEEPSSVNRPDTENVIREELQSTRNKWSAPSRVSVRQISMILSTKQEESQSTTVVGIFGPAAIEAILAGKMLKILRSEKLRARCRLGEGKCIKAVEFNKRSITRNEILISHKKYVTSQGRVDLSGRWILNLHEPVSTELCQEILPTALQLCSKIDTKLDLFNHLILNELQTKAAKIKYHRTYGKGVINIYVSTDNIHNGYEALNKLELSPH